MFFKVLYLSSNKKCLTTYPKLINYVVSRRFGGLLYLSMSSWAFFISFSFSLSLSFSLSVSRLTMEVALNLELTSLLQHKEVLSKAKSFATIRQWVQKDNKRGGGARPKRASASAH